MLEIFCAIYPEAKPLIQHFSLKKETTNDRWDHFINAEQTIRLTLTGCGKVESSGAITGTLLFDSDPFVVSYGSAAYLDAFHKDVYIASSICDIDTGIAYYLDMFWNVGIEECGIFTGSQILMHSKNTRRTIEPAFSLGTYLEKLHAENQRYILYDMESSAVYQAANAFVGPDKMLFIKFASDNDADQINASELSALSENAFEKVEQVFLHILSEMEKQDVLPDVSLFEKKIHASASMSLQIRQIVRYCVNAGIDYQSVMEEFMQEDIKDKADGKRVFDAFRYKCCEY